MNNPNNFNYQAPQDLLHDKVILVTGAGDGIGRAAALAFAEHGATVLLLGKTQKKLDQTYDDIIAKGYPEPVSIPLDMEKAGLDEYGQLQNLIDEHFGRLDGLLHNASILGDLRPLQSYPADLFKRVLNINVTAQFLMTKALLPLLDSSAAASVLFTSSSVGRSGRAHWGAYAISKFATEGMMQTLADEVANISNIRVNSINPGATATKMRATAYPAEDPSTLRKAEEIMGTYLYLMGEDSQTINGEAWDAQARKT